MQSSPPRTASRQSCLDYINLLEDLLEAETSTSRFTPEYDETPQIGHDEVNNDLHQR